VAREPDYIEAVPSTAAEFAFPLLSPDATATLLGVINIELTKSHGLSVAQREWLIRFSEPLAKTIAYYGHSVVISHAEHDDHLALTLAKDLSNAGISVELNPAETDLSHFADESLEIDKSIIILLSRASADSSRQHETIARALRSKLRILPVVFENCPVPFDIRGCRLIDFRTDYAAGLEEILRILRPSGFATSETSNADASVAADHLRSQWHPAHDLDNRGDLTPCTFTVNSKYQTRGKYRWKTWGDVLVDLDDAPNRDYVYLLPSRLAPAKFQGRYPLSRLRAECLHLVSRFVRPEQE
jgi:TIR domain